MTVEYKLLTRDGSSLLGSRSGHVLLGSRDVDDVPDPSSDCCSCICQFCDDLNIRTVQLDIYGYENTLCTCVCWCPTTPSDSGFAQYNEVICRGLCAVLTGSYQLLLDPTDPCCFKSIWAAGTCEDPGISYGESGPCSYIVGGTDPFCSGAEYSSVGLGPTDLHVGDTVTLRSVNYLLGIRVCLEKIIATDATYLAWSLEYLVSTFTYGSVNGSPEYCSPGNRFWGRCYEGSPLRPRVCGFTLCDDSWSPGITPLTDWCAGIPSVANGKQFPCNRVDSGVVCTAPIGGQIQFGCYGPTSPTGFLTAILTPQIDS